MARCRRCDVEVEAEALERHEVDGLVHVHCPDCGQTLGRYNRHTRSTPTDRT